MPKTLLIVGGSHADIPIIESAHALGYKVYTSGNDHNGLAHQYSDGYYDVDYSDINAVLKLVESLDIDAICASANDFSALSCAYAAEKLNLSGHDRYENALILHHKDRFRAFAMQHKLLVPKAQSVHKSNKDGFTPDLDYPLMVKPIDLSGGKGMKRVENSAELAAAIDSAFSATRSETIILEEYIEGSNHGYSTFIKNGKVVFAFMDDEYYFKNPYLVAGASTSVHFSKELADEINRSLEKLAGLLNLVDGLLHVQFILKDGKPYILEICRRTPGDLYVKLVEYATGFNMSKAIVQSSFGLAVDVQQAKEINYITRHCVMPEHNGIIKDVYYGGLKERIFDKMIFFRKDDEIQDYMTYKAEIDFIKYVNMQKMIECIRTITDKIKIKFK